MIFCSLHLIAAHNSAQKNHLLVPVSAAAAADREAPRGDGEFTLLERFGASPVPHHRTSLS